MAPSGDFWSEKGQMNDEQPATPAEVAALRAYIEHRTDLIEAKRALMSASEAEGPLESAAVKSMRVAELLAAVAEEFPEEHVRLVELIQALLSMQPEEMGWTEEQKVRYLDWKEWPDHGGIIVTLQEARDDAGHTRLEPSTFAGETLEDTFKRYVRLHSLFAHWYKVRQFHWDLEVGMFNVRAAIEKQLPPEAYPTADNLVSQYDIDVQGALPYLEIDGAGIYRSLDQRDLFPKCFPPDRERTDMYFPPGTVELWHGQPGLSIERWLFWKKRILEIREMPYLRQDTKDAVDRTVAAMNRAE